MTSRDYLNGFIESILKAELPLHHLQSVLIYLLSNKIPETNNIMILGLGADDIFGTITQNELYTIDKNFFLKLW